MCRPLKPGGVLIAPPSSPAAACRATARVQNLPQVVREGGAPGGVAPGGREEARRELDEVFRAAHVASGGVPTSHQEQLIEPSCGDERLQSRSELSAATPEAERVDAREVVRPWWKHPSQGAWCPRRRTKQSPRYHRTTDSCDPTELCSAPSERTAMACPPHGHQ